MAHNFKYASANGLTLYEKYAAHFFSSSKREAPSRNALCTTDVFGLVNSSNAWRLSLACTGPPAAFAFGSASSPPSMEALRWKPRYFIIQPMIWWAHCKLCKVRIKELHNVGLEKKSNVFPTRQLCMARHSLSTSMPSTGSATG